MVLNWGDVAPQGTFGSVGRIFDLRDWGKGGCCWHLVGRVRGAAKHATVQRAVPTTKDYLAQKVRLRLRSSNRNDRNTGPVGPQGGLSHSAPGVLVVKECWQKATCDIGDKGKAWFTSKQSLVQYGNPRRGWSAVELGSNPGAPLAAPPL